MDLEVTEGRICAYMCPGVKWLLGDVMLLIENSIGVCECLCVFKDNK